MACKEEKVLVTFLDRDDPVELPLVDSCEELWRYAARKILKVKPTVLDIFGLKCNECWLTPSDPVPRAFKKLELRLRFKPPQASRLKRIDLPAFRYYYSQVRYDLNHGRLLKIFTVDINKSNKNGKWYFPFIADKEAAKEAKKKRVQFLSSVVTAVSLNIIVDILSGVRDKDTAMSQFESYLPDEIWVNVAEKQLIGLRELKQTASKVVDKTLSDKAVTVDLVKEKFLRTIETNLSEYFHEIFDVYLRSLESKQAEAVTIKVVPPCKDNEPYLALYKHRHPEQKLCDIEEICNISTNVDDDGVVSMEIARKNGIPLHLAIKNTNDGWSFLTLLTGYYRLCEKWIFCLCPAVIYPSLNKLLDSKTHGPVDNQFVIEKFKASPERQQVGTYLIRRSCDNHFTYFLHYVFISNVSEGGVMDRSMKVIMYICWLVTCSFPRKYKNPMQCTK